MNGAIHRAAGPLLLKENKSLGGCPDGEARISCGYRLPARCKGSLTPNILFIDKISILILIRPYFILFLVQLIDFIDSSSFLLHLIQPEYFPRLPDQMRYPPLDPKENIQMCWRPHTKNSLEVMIKNNLRSIVRSLEIAEKVIIPIHWQAFPCISTGVYGYPPVAACGVALTTAKAFLEKHHDKVVAFASWHISYSLQWQKIA